MKFGRLSLLSLLLVGSAFAMEPGFEKPHFLEVDASMAKLGQLLFYDPILSGGKDVSCATCHHPAFGTSDGLALGLGDGGMGLGTERRVDPANRPEQRVPRNAQSLFNLGFDDVRVLFHDGRLETTPELPGGLRTPLGSEMVEGFDGLLSAQTMFPVLSPDEMAGHYQESDVSQAVRMGLLTEKGGAWDLIAGRVNAIAAYRQGFNEALGHDRPIVFTDIANALGAFIAYEWRADNSPFDRFLFEGEALPSESARRGMDLFYGRARCAECHSGVFQTDQSFHAIAMPQIGPGKAGRFESHARDEGRGLVTGRAEDNYKFRTPSLRNITVTQPYGHSGAFATLEGVIRHHLNPVASLHAYQLDGKLPELTGANDQIILSSPEDREAIAAQNELAPLSLKDQEVQDLIAFLETLTDPQSLEGRLGIPDRVPSGLPVERGPQSAQ